MKIKIHLFVFLIFLLHCSKQNFNYEEYRAELDRWHHKRLERLTAPEGWLSLAGLYWLKEGENTFGFGSGYDIVFPDGNDHLTLGSFYLHNGKVTVRLNPAAKVWVDSQLVLQTDLQSDETDHPTRMEFGRYLWYLIKRGERYGIRLKDRQSPNIKSFKGIERFPVDPKWHIDAQFIPYDSIRVVHVPTVLGTQASSKSPGELEFYFKDQKYRLQALADSVNEPFFIIFADETNGQETYGAGRFLVVAPPDAQGHTFIDFNKAYNPPCAFTEFATCPLPPKENYLPFKVLAGEKAYQGGLHHSE